MCIVYRMIHTRLCIIHIHVYVNMCTDSEGDARKSSHDFGLHPSDAEQEVGWQMRNGGVEEQLVTLGHEWHPGRLLYYNRAELKQSDHRCEDIIIYNILFLTSLA